MFSKNISSLLGYVTTSNILTDVNDLIDFIKLPAYLNSEKIDEMYTLVKGSNKTKTESTHKFNRDLNIPKMVDVQVREIVKTIASNGFSSSLNVVPGPVGNDGTVHNFAPLNPITCFIREPVLTKLSFSLLDYYTKELLMFSPGTSTYVTLALSESKTEMSQELLTVISNDRQALKTRPLNSNTKFTVNLPRYLTLEGFSGWSLKLLSFNFTAEIRNIESSYSFFDIYSLQNSVEPTQIRCSFKPGKYNTIQDLITEINKALSQIKDIRYKLYLSLDVNSHVIVTNMSDSGCNVKINPELMSVLGGSLTKTNVYIKQNSYLTMPRYADVNLSRPRFIKILCHQTQPSLFGSVMEQVFAFFSIDSAQNSNNMSCYYQFLDPPKIALNVNVLSELSFTITSGSSSNPIEVENLFNTPTHLLLSLERF